MLRKRWVERDDLNRCILCSRRPQPQRRPTIGPALDQHVEDLALVVDGSPEVHPLASNPDYHLVEVPASAREGSRRGFAGIACA